MLTTYPGGKAASAPIDPQETWWVDLVNPTDKEKAAAESMCRLTIPSREELSEIESSSRISEEDGVLYLSMPIVSFAANVDDAPSPLGFVLSKDYEDSPPLPHLPPNLEAHHRRQDRRRGTIELLASLTITPIGGSHDETTYRTRNMRERA